MNYPPTGRGLRARVVGLSLAAAAVGLGLAGCSGSEPAAEGYHPSHVEEIEGSDVKEVTITSDAAVRLGLETVATEKSGSGTLVPYAALIYDGNGAPWVYTVTDELTFVRKSIVVDRIEANRAWLLEGPAIGTQVVTTGAAEIFGSELGIEGGH